MRETIESKISTFEGGTFELITIIGETFKSWGTTTESATKES